MNMMIHCHMVQMYIQKCEVTHASRGNVLVFHGMQRHIWEELANPLSLLLNLMAFLPLLASASFCLRKAFTSDFLKNNHTDKQSITNIHNKAHQIILILYICDSNSPESRKLQNYFDNVHSNKKWNQSFGLNTIWYRIRLIRNEILKPWLKK